jgi:hypothetical protein
MAFRDLREWMVTLEGEGELARVKTKITTTPYAVSSSLGP